MKAGYRSQLRHWMIRRKHVHPFVVREERGLKVSKKIREEVRRNEKSDEESDDSHPGKVRGFAL